MVDFTQYIYAEEETTNMFMDQLINLTEELNLPSPEFFGKKLLAIVLQAWQHWIITTVVWGRQVISYTNDITFVKPYVNWGNGIKQAAQEALARTSWQYWWAIPKGHPFGRFGRRYINREPIGNPNREGMSLEEKHYEDMESHVANLEQYVEEFLSEYDELMGNRIILEKDVQDL